jgi:hypothetical protein
MHSKLQQTNADWDRKKRVIAVTIVPAIWEESGWYNIIKPPKTTWKDELHPGLVSTGDLEWVCGLAKVTGNRTQCLCQGGPSPRKTQSKCTEEAHRTQGAPGRKLPGQQGQALEPSAQDRRGQVPLLPAPLPDSPGQITGGRGTSRPQDARGAS